MAGRFALRVSLAPGVTADVPVSAGQVAGIRVLLATAERDPAVRRQLEGAVAKALEEHFARQVADGRLSAIPSLPSLPGLELVEIEP